MLGFFKFVTIFSELNFLYKIYGILNQLLQTLSEVGIQFRKFDIKIRSRMRRCGLSLRKKNHFFWTLMKLMNFFSGLIERDNIFDLLELFKNVLEYQNISQHVRGSNTNKPFLIFYKKALNNKGLRKSREFLI